MIYRGIKVKFKANSFVFMVDRLKHSTEYWYQAKKIIDKAFTK